MTDEAARDVEKKIRVHGKFPGEIAKTASKDANRRLRPLMVDLASLSKVKKTIQTPSLKADVVPITKRYPKEGQGRI